MKKSTLDIVNLELERMQYIHEAAVQSAELREKLARSMETIRITLNEDAAMYSGQRRGVKAARTNLVLKNPVLLSAAEKLIGMNIGENIPVSDLCEPKYLRVVVTYVRTKIPDFRYYTYESCEERYLVKTAGEIPEDKGETFEPTLF